MPQRSHAWTTLRACKPPIRTRCNMSASDPHAVTTHQSCIFMSPTSFSTAPIRTIACAQSSRRIHLEAERIGMAMHAWQAHVHACCNVSRALVLERLHAPLGVLVSLPHACTGVHHDHACSCILTIIYNKPHQVKLYKKSETHNCCRLLLSKRCPPGVVADRMSARFVAMQQCAAKTSTVKTYQFVTHCCLQPMRSTDINYSS